MQLRFALKFALPFALLCAALLWTKEKIGSTCEAAAALGRNFPRAAVWLAESERDPFLARRLDRPRLQLVLRQFQATAAISREDYGLLRLNSATKRQLTSLAEARTPETLSRAAAGFDPAPLVARCTVPPGAREEVLLRQLAAAEDDWRGVKAEVAAEKLDFKSDREIFCQLDHLRAELERVLRAAEERCRLQSGKGGCAAASTRALKGELRDLEEKRNFNLTKLQRKWPVGAVEGIKCEASSI